MDDGISFRRATRVGASALMRLTRALAACGGREAEASATAEYIAAGMLEGDSLSERAREAR